MKKEPRPVHAVDRERGSGPWKASGWGRGCCETSGLPTLCEPPKHCLTPHPTNRTHPSNTGGSGTRGQVSGRVLSGGVLVPLVQGEVSTWQAFNKILCPPAFGPKGGLVGTNGYS